MRTRNRFLNRLWGKPESVGTVRVKAVRCNKSACKSCPHSFYAYYRVYMLGYATEEYLGKCFEDGKPRGLPGVKIKSVGERKNGRKKMG